MSLHNYIFIIKVAIGAKCDKGTKLCSANVCEAPVDIIYQTSISERPWNPPQDDDAKDDEPDGFHAGELIFVIQNILIMTFKFKNINL